ncbi:matrix metalloproteinase-11 [Cladophialophora carrionii]|uniref:Matrix metalloproteinase-11 n=1 Tax=Cladophialophora carrionii TaxID=86049 RepID=A0A1C1D079_9EURO|nr:matrix metalloproteinase-11 [Cladophialophora carrionii]
MGSKNPMPSDPPDSKPLTWCGTEPSSNLNEADLAPVPDTGAMAAEGKKQYPCVTQSGLQETFGEPPSDEQSGDGSGRDHIVVGVGPIIPRWTASTSNPTKLLYFPVREGFLSDADFEYAATAFQQAADEWNAIGFGVNISRTSNRAQANFVVRYFKPAVDEGVLASAFFPNDVDDVLVYHKTLVEPRWRAILKNTFLHEIGHIIGLRHEFAIKGDTLGNRPERTPAKQFGSENPHSVMSYEDINNIQDTDKHDVKEFYKLPNNSEIDGVKIWDYVPKPLRQ